MTPEDTREALVTRLRQPGRRYCGMCDEWVNGRECPKCGADTDAPVKERP